MSEWQYKKLESYLGSAISLGRGDIISKDDINDYPGPYPIYSSSAHNNGKFGEFGKFMFDEELITWSIDGGGSFFYRPKHKFSVTNVCGYMRIREKELDAQFIYYCLSNQHKYLTFDYTTKAHPSVIKKLYSIPNIEYAQQRKIAKILVSLDGTIEKTEALIEKYQQVKAGLMHDLFTRGITADGKLRPSREQAPELYQETAIGWIPNEWELESIDSLTESVVDGPFGSNLKTEHYVTDPEVRVVRLQNIQAGKYNDNDKAFVAYRHAQMLSRNKVSGGDILVAGLGEERYPVGRACLYPQGLRPAINKADCFRIRCAQEKMINSYLMYFLNTSISRKQIGRYEQGVTRPRINTGNMKKIMSLKPSLWEQNMVVSKLDNVQSLIEAETYNVKKYLKQKSGLMQDLLTGKVPVPLDKETPHV